MSELSMKLRKNISEPQWLELEWVNRGRYVICPNSGMVYDMKEHKVVETEVKGRLLEHRSAGREYALIQDRDGVVVPVGVEILLTRTYYELDNDKVYPHYMDGITTHNRLTNIMLVDSLAGRLSAPKRKTFDRRYDLARIDVEYGRLQDKALLEDTLEIAIRHGIGYDISELL